jgi:hypothetical protein
MGLGPRCRVTANTATEPEKPCRCARPSPIRVFCVHPPASALHPFLLASPRTALGRDDPRFPCASQDRMYLSRTPRRIVPAIPRAQRNNPITVATGRNQAAPIRKNPMHRESRQPAGAVTPPPRQNPMHRESIRPARHAGTAPADRLTRVSWPGLARSPTTLPSYICIVVGARAKPGHDTRVSVNAAWYHPTRNETKPRLCDIRQTQHPYAADAG